MHSERLRSSGHRVHQGIRYKGKKNLQRFALDDLQSPFQSRLLNNSVIIRLEGTWQYVQIAGNIPFLSLQSLSQVAQIPSSK